MGPLASRPLLDISGMLNLQATRVNLAAKGGSFKLHKLRDNVLSWLQHWSREAQQQLWGRLEPALVVFQEPCDAPKQVTTHLNKNKGPEQNSISPVLACLQEHVQLPCHAEPQTQTPLDSEGRQISPRP